MDNKWTQAKVMVIQDTQKDPRWLPHPEMNYTRGWVGTPLLVKGRFIGSLNVDSRLPGAYSAEDGDTVMGFANQAAVAIENARLFEAERTRARSEALRDAARIISSSLSLHEVLQAMLEQLEHVITFDSGNVMLLEGEKLEIKVWWGYDAFVDPEDVDAVAFDLNSEFFCSRVVRSGQPLTIKKVQEHPDWQVPRNEPAYQFLVGCTLLVHEECIGLFSLDRSSYHGFSEERSNWFSLMPCMPVPPLRTRACSKPKANGRLAQRPCVRPA